VISCRTVGTSNASPRRKGELWSKMSLSSSKRPYPSDVPSDRKHETVCRAALMLPHCGTVTSPHVGGSFSHESYESQPRKTTSTSTENQKPKTKNQKPKTKNQKPNIVDYSLFTIEVQPRHHDNSHTACSLAYKRLSRCFPAATLSLSVFADQNLRLNSSSKRTPLRYQGLCSVFARTPYHLQHTTTVSVHLPRTTSHLLL
jgi:hypothetical protein